MRVFWLNLALLLITACKPHSSTDGIEKEVKSDDAVLVMSVPETQTQYFDQMDVSFNDFIYKFMQDSLFQKERIIFPLHYAIDGSLRHVTSSQWSYDEMYINQDLYTLIYDSEKSMSTKSDSGLYKVVVDNVYLQSQRIKQYAFVKREGRWFLKNIDDHDLKNDVNHDFYAFYRLFTANPDYEWEHIKDPFYFCTYDAENDQFIEGVLDREQWPDYRPELPQDTLININYSQHYEQTSERLVLICSPSGGMGYMVTFVRHGHKWLFSKLDN